MHLLQLVLLTVLLLPYIVGAFFFHDQQLYEGSNCTLQNGQMGVCTRLPNCSYQLEKRKNGPAFKFYDSDRCGFVNFIEIICCPRSMNAVQGKQINTFKTACTEYKRLHEAAMRIPIPEEDAVFHTVVFNGLVAMEFEFPYMAALGYRNPENASLPLQYRCGGTLISRYHVLTAGHCVNNINNDTPVQIMLGSIYLDRFSKDTQFFEISEIITHPGYRRSRNYNDIAIIRLKTQANISRAVVPACLLTEPLEYVNTTQESLSFTATGWGATSYDVDTSQKLLKTRYLSFVDAKGCGEMYKDFARLPNGLDNSLLCVIDMDDNRRSDTCFGDSGGPLLMKENDDTYLAGVTAFGQACASSIPAVYTAVYPFLDWIHKIAFPN